MYPPPPHIAIHMCSVYTDRVEDVQAHLMGAHNYCSQEMVYFLIECVLYG